MDQPIIHQSKLLELPDVVLMELLGWVPYCDRKTLLVAHPSLKKMCRLVSSLSENPEKIVVNKSQTCCGQLWELSEVIRRGCDFIGLKGITVKIQSYGEEESCTRYKIPAGMPNAFSAFLNCNMELKYIDLDLPNWNLYQKCCPLPMVIRTWLKRQCSFIETLCLNGDALNWIVNPVFSQMDMDCSACTFPLLQKLKINGCDASKKQIDMILRVSPNLKHLNVCGSVELQQDIPKSRINIVHWVAAHSRDRTFNEHALRSLAVKMPMLKRIDISLLQRHKNCESSVISLLKSSTNSLEEMFCCSFNGWNDLPCFPNLKMLTLCCNYKELETDFSPIVTLQLSTTFPNLQEIRFLSTVEHNHQVFRGLDPNNANYSRAFSVTRIGFDSGPTKKLLCQLKIEFPNVIQVTVCDEVTISRVGAVWKHLEKLSVYEANYDRKADSLGAALLGINVKELKLLKEAENPDILQFANVPPRKPTVIDIFPNLKTITWRHDQGCVRSKLHNTVRNLLHQRCTTRMNVVPTEYFSFFWDWNSY